MLNLDMEAGRISADPDRLGIIKIHFPINRESTDALRDDCLVAVKKSATSFFAKETTSVLMTDHNTHAGMPAWGGKTMYEVGLDYIGRREFADGAEITVLRKKKLKSRIDGHYYIGARSLVKWPSGLRTKIWFVQANLGRGVSSAVYRAEVLRIKRAFRGHVILGFDEIDEADKPAEHPILKSIFAPAGWHLAEMDTYSPVLASPKLRLVASNHFKACEGLARVTPHRDLIQVMIRPPVKRTRKKFMSS